MSKFKKGDRVVSSARVDGPVGTVALVDSTDPELCQVVWDGDGSWHSVESRWLDSAPALPPAPAPTEVRVTDASTGGQKGSKREVLGDLDPQSLMNLARVAGYGRGKYGALNYVKGYDWSLSYNALQRHLAAWWGGEDIDPESGLPHLAHAGVHCCFLLTFQREGRGQDDRFGTFISQLRNGEHK